MFGDEDLRAEHLERLRGLERDDEAHEQADERHDRQGVDAGLLEDDGDLAPAHRARPPEHRREALDDARRGSRAAPGRRRASRPSRRRPAEERPALGGLFDRGQRLGRRKGARAASGYSGRSPRIVARTPGHDAPLGELVEQRHAGHVAAVDRRSRRRRARRRVRRRASRPTSRRAPAAVATSSGAGQRQQRPPSRIARGGRRGGAAASLTSAGSLRAAARPGRDLQRHEPADEDRGIELPDEGLGGRERAGDGMDRA